MEKFNKMATAAPAKEITPGSFEAVASNHELDRVGDRVLGWDLKEIQRNPVLLWGHDPTAPIGKIDSLRVETGELLVRFTLTEGVSQADEALKLLQAGAVRALSIGFTSVGEATPNDEGGIDFEKVSIHEISLVGVPAVPAALAAAFDPEDPRSPKSAVRALSIGFTSVGEATPNDEGGIDFEKVSIHEISLVGVPAVPAALAAAFDPEDPRSPKESRSKKICPESARSKKICPKAILGGGPRGNLLRNRNPRQQGTRTPHDER